MKRQAMAATFIIGIGMGLLFGSNGSAGQERIITCERRWSIHRVVTFPVDFAAGVWSEVQDIRRYRE